MNGALPTNLIGICVTFGTARAPIFLVTPGQLNVQAPQLPSSRSISVQVLTNCETPQQSASNTIAVTVQPAAPEFFYASNNGSGLNPVAALSDVRLAKAILKRESLGIKSDQNEALLGLLDGTSRKALEKTLQRIRAREDGPMDEFKAIR